MTVLGYIVAGRSVSSYEAWATFIWLTERELDKSDITLIEVVMCPPYLRPSTREMNIFS